MSLARIALRMAAVAALTGRTEVGDNVLDSEIGAIRLSQGGDQIESDQKKPFIAVYTDSSKAEGIRDIDLRSLCVNGDTELVFDIGVTTAMLVTDPETEQTEVMVGIPATDAAFEFAIDMIARQIGDALTDPDNDWAEIFRGLFFRIGKIERFRRSNDLHGGRIAGMQIRITGELIDDPLRGMAMEPDAPFARFLAAVLASEDAVLAAQGARMQEALEGADEVWVSLQRRFGMTRAELLALGLGPLADDEERETPDMAAGRLDVDGMQPVAVDDDAS